VLARDQPDCYDGIPSQRTVSTRAGKETASHATTDLSFNLLHKKADARIQNKRFCSEEGVEVPWSDVVKGYEPTRSLI
jgi:hypothetical protein